MLSIAPDERFTGTKVVLRLCTLDDCTERYVDWLQDPEVAQYLETRWSEQTLATVRAFVGSMLDDPASWLFAICDPADGTHVGNIKVGPIAAHHGYADVSFFIGDRTRWGQGLATDAIRVATRVAFERLGVQRAAAGAYEANVGSVRALEHAGYRHEGLRPAMFTTPSGRQGHVLLGLPRDAWEASEANAP